MQWLFFPFLPIMVVCMSSGLLPMTDELLEERLYASIIVGKYDEAVTKSIDLETDDKGHVISKVVNRLLTNKKRNLMEYAYQLWIEEEAKRIVENYFSLQFKLILDGNYVEIVHKSSGDQYETIMSGNEGDDNIKLNTWMFVPRWESNRLYFKLKNMECNLYTYMSRDDHATYGSVNSNTPRHQWYLQPVNHENDVIFFIFNRQYKEALQFKDIKGDGEELGHGNSNNVEGRPDVFGWIFVPSDHQPESYNCLN